jgi:ABC-type transporter Mla subunit MlaD
MTAVTSRADLEARVAALEADRADYRAVLAAVGALGGRVDGLSERVDGLTEGMDGLSERVDGLTEHVQTVEIKTDANGEAINALGEKLAGFQTETRTRFEAVDAKIDGLRQEMTGRFRSMDDQFGEIKASSSIGSAAAAKSTRSGACPGGRLENASRPPRGYADPRA